LLIDCCHSVTGKKRGWKPCRVAQTNLRPHTQLLAVVRHTFDPGAGHLKTLSAKILGPAVTTIASGALENLDALSALGECMGGRYDGGRDEKAK
jgi:hypothetical protein